MTVVAAVSYGELAASMPWAGGQYVFLREAYGRLCGFLYGWSMLVVIQTATIAAVAIGFAKFAGVLLPVISSSRWILPIGTVGPFRTGVTLGPYTLGLNTQNLVAILSIVLLTWINTRGLRAGARVQNFFTITKVLSLAALIVAGFAHATPTATRLNFSHFWGTGGVTAAGLLAILPVAMVGALFSADAWNTVTFAAAEVRAPERNLPLALIAGAGTVTVLYLLVNLSYLTVLPLAGSPQAGDVLGRGIQFATEDRVATAVVTVVLGRSAALLMAIAIMVSTFGANNGLVLGGSRVFYAMSRDGLFFQGVGRLNGRSVPAAALWVQCAWSALLCLSATYSQLLDFVIFSVLVFYAATIIGVFVLRLRKPTLHRPYMALGYPVLPALYVAAAIFIAVQLLRYKPDYTWPGLLLVLSGVPAYFLWTLWNKIRRETGFTVPKE
jgi:APA family basic amino acid/polyamine antiporter